MVHDRRRPYPKWPVFILAMSAFVAIWGGWVSLGQMAGFGPVHLLPGIADVSVDLSITLPLGMEVYAAYATGAWLSDRDISRTARNFAKWSSLIALVVGAAGQAAYHLMVALGIEKAPWPIVVVVATVPVAVLGMGSHLAYQLSGHAEAAPRSQADPVATQVDPDIDEDWGVDPIEQPEAAGVTEPEVQDVASALDVEASAPDQRDDAPAPILSVVEPEDADPFTTQVRSLAGEGFGVGEIAVRLRRDSADVKAALGLAA
jgi:hypothetical protein